MPDLGTPAHCADEYDERSWAITGECNDDHHSFVADATIALNGWLDLVLGAVQTSLIGPVHFPASTGIALSGHGQVIDPSLTYLLLCQARRGDDPIDALYVGLVSRDPATRWRGLTGFYIPYCGRCHPDPAATARRIVEWLPDEAVVQTPDRLPGPIQPSPGWFEGRMLLGVRLPNPASTNLSPDWTQYPHAGRPNTGPALACVGTLETGRHNLLFLDNAATDLPALSKALTAWKPASGAPRIAYRLGERSDLLELAGGVRSSRRPTDLVSMEVLHAPQRRHAPIDWGVLKYRDDSDLPSAQVSSNLRGLARGTAKKIGRKDGDVLANVYYWPDGDGVIAFRHLRWLMSWATHSG